MPGVTTSGFASSPPRLEKNATGSGAVAAVAVRCTNTVGKVAPTEMARVALPGKPTVERPGPSLPALMVITTSGLAARNESTTASIRAPPSRSFPTPKLRLRTSGSRRCRAVRSA